MNVHNCDTDLCSDFPGEACGSRSDQASVLQWKNKSRRRRTSQQESSSEHGASEADIDSDSGYCSPKHNQGGVNPSANQNTAPAVRAKTRVCVFTIDLTLMCV